MSVLGWTIHILKVANCRFSHGCPLLSGPVVGSPGDTKITRMILKKTDWFKIPLKD